MLLLCTIGVQTTQAKTEKVHATFENPSNTNTSWNAETKTFTWSTTYYNQLRNIGLPTGDLTKYKKLVVDCDIKSGDQFRILFYKGGSNKTLYASNGVNEFILTDTLKALYPDDYNEFLLACDEICLSGNNNAAPGEAVINDVYLETYDDEGEKVYATFESPSNTNTSWNAETKTFTWSTTYYNQLRNIGLPTGDITKYKKLVVDCDIKSGDQFRVLFYKGGSNKTLYASNGVNEFILADTLKALYPDDYNEFLLACDEICLSGNNNVAPGEAVINAVYLETYPENESVEIPDIVYEEDPGKPVGNFVDLTEAFPSLQPRLGLGTDGHPIVLGNGDVVVGQRTKDVIANLSAYSKLTLVTSPNLKLVVYMNHEIDAKQNASDYTEEEAGKYVFLNVQADENGIAEVDLTQYNKQDLNCICLPWDNSNKGTVWYLLLTEKEEVPVITPAYGSIWDAETGETTTEDGLTVITLGSEYFKDFAKAEDTIRVSIANVAQARAARIVKKGELTVKTAEGEILLENKDIKADETAIDIVLDEDALAKIAAAENVLFIYKNLTVTKIELLEKPAVEPQPQPTGIAEGKYYIYNVGVNKYLAAGANWGTHAIVNERGLDYGLALADGKYTIDSQVSNGGANNYLNGEWNDGPAFGWEFNEVAEGIYTISNGENFLTAGENGLVTLAGDATVAAAQWTLVTVADRDSINLKTLEAATAENGVDATFFIKGADFNRNDLRNKAWTATKSGGNQTIGGPSADRLTYGCESWNNTFDVNQTLENLPDGVYEFSIAGYGTNGTTYIYANETEAAFVNTESAANFGDAADRIANGEFAGNTTGKVNVVGGTLKIGVKRTSQVGQDWAVFDKAQLTYYGAISADAYKAAYEEALAAAQAALADEAYAAVTGEEKAALEKAIADYTTVEATQDAYVAATVALNAATDAFKTAKAAYEELAAAKDDLTAKQYAYAAAAKKTAAEEAAEVTATSAADAQAKTAALYQAYRQYAESHALAEGVETAVNKTDLIVNPDAEEAIAEPWAVVKGEGSGGSLNILNGEPWTDGEGNSAHKYFDGGDWGATSWDVALQQEITLPAGKYLLTAKGRAAGDVTLTLFAGENIVEMPAVGASGALFDRGWDDTSVEFVVAEEGPVTIGVRGVTTAQYNWMSFSNFRLVQLSATSVGISTVNAAKQQSGVIYNLQGQKMTKAQKGLYIIGGKKVMVK